MKQFTYQITDPNGMHARPAGMLATFAKRFHSDVRVKNGEKEADGKRLLSLMSLGATNGTELIFCITGEDEELCAQELERYCRAQMSAFEKKDNGTNEQ